jgi:DNA-binding NarL/FixJ family response regulator
MRYWISINAGRTLVCMARSIPCNTGVNLEPGESMPRVRIFLHVRGALLRRGLQALFADIVDAEFGAHDTAAYRNFALSGPVDLIVADVDDVQNLMREVPERKWPHRVMLLSAGTAPADAWSRWPGNTCGLLSMDDDLERIQDILGRAASCDALRREDGPCGGCNVPKTMQPHVLPLSGRELAVFKALGKGLGPTAIAAELGISVKTFESFRERIKLKLGVQSNADLFSSAVAWRLGYLSLCMRAKREQARADQRGR